MQDGSIPSLASEAVRNDEEQPQQADHDRPVTAPSSCARTYYGPLWPVRHPPRGTQHQWTSSNYSSLIMWPMGEGRLLLVPLFAQRGATDADCLLTPCRPLSKVLSRFPFEQTMQSRVPSAISLFGSYGVGRKFAACLFSCEVHSLGRPRLTCTTWRLRVALRARQRCRRTAGLCVLLCARVDVPTLVAATAAPVATVAAAAARWRRLSVQAHRYREGADARAGMGRR